MQAQIMGVRKEEKVGRSGPVHWLQSVQGVVLPHSSFP